MAVIKYALNYTVCIYEYTHDYKNEIVKMNDRF